MYTHCKILLYHSYIIRFYRMDSRIKANSTRNIAQTCIDMDNKKTRIHFWTRAFVSDRYSFTV